MLQTGVNALTEQTAAQLELAQDERRLIARAGDGDGRAFAALVQPHLSLLYRAAYRFTRDAFLAEDVVQETLLAACQGLSRYEPGTSLRAFLVAIAIPRAYSVARSERRIKKREQLAPTVATSAGVEDELRAKQVGLQIVEALDRMPARRREAVVMRLDAGLSHAEIARAMGATEGSIRVLVHRGIKELRGLLGGTNHG